MRGSATKKRNFHSTNNRSRYIKNVDEDGFEQMESGEKRRTNSCSEDEELSLKEPISPAPNDNSTM